MNINKLFNASVALEKLRILNDVTMEDSHRHKRRGRGYTQTVKGATAQEIKLAIALSDTSYSTMHRAIEYKEHFIESQGDLAKYYAILSRECFDVSNPLDSALELLNRL